jgi:transcriptional regulator GlxA family with amidase domain
MKHYNILLFDQSYAASVAITLDMLAAAALLAKVQKVAPPTWQLVSVDGGQVNLTNGMSVSTVAIEQAYKNKPAVWIIPGLGISSVSEIQYRLRKHDIQIAVTHLEKLARAAETICAACSSVFILQAANLLANKRVTTTWWLAGLLQKIEPNCQVNENWLVMRDGNIVTAGAALAQTDLMLNLLKASYGERLTNTVARALLIDQRNSQAPYVVPAGYAQGDQFIVELTERIEAALPDAPNMQALAEHFNVSTRTLARKVFNATGKTPLAVLQGIRIHLAQNLLRTTNLSVEAVAAEVGYTDTTALRKLLKKTHQITPRQLRRPS